MPIYALGDLVPEIASSAFVHPDAVIIGRVAVGPESTVWPAAVLRGDHGAITVGAQTSIQDGAVIHCTAELDTRIGDRCTVGHLAHLEGCTMEAGSLVGSGATVLHRAVIGSGGTCRRCCPGLTRHRRARRGAGPRGCRQGSPRAVPIRRCSSTPRPHMCAMPIGTPPT